MIFVAFAQHGWCIKVKLAKIFAAFCFRHEFIVPENIPKLCFVSLKFPIEKSQPILRPLKPSKYRCIYSKAAKTGIVTCTYDQQMQRCKLLSPQMSDVDNYRRFFRGAKP